MYASQIARVKLLHQFLCEASGIQGAEPDAYLVSAGSRIIRNKDTINSDLDKVIINSEVRGTFGGPLAGSMVLSLASNPPLTNTDTTATTKQGTKRSDKPVGSTSDGELALSSSQVWFALPLPIFLKIVGAFSALLFLPIHYEAYVIVTVSKYSDRTYRCDTTHTEVTSNSFTTDAFMPLISSAFVFKVK